MMRLYCPSPSIPSYLCAISWYIASPSVRLLPLVWAERGSHTNPASHITGEALLLSHELLLGSEGVDDLALLGLTELVLVMILLNLGSRLSLASLGADAASGLGDLGGGRRVLGGLALLRGDGD